MAQGPTRTHPLAEVLANAAVGTFPAGDEPVTVVPAPPHLGGAVLAFSGQTYVAADVVAAEVAARLGADPLAGPLRPAFIEWLAVTVSGQAHNTEVVLAARGSGTPSASLTPEPRWADHDRARHGAALRREVHGWRLDEGQGIVLIGRGFVDRWALAYEVAPGAPPGTGRALAAAALGLVPAGEALFAQVAPGHARSLRATLAAGFVPIGSEVLITR